MKLTFLTTPGEPAQYGLVSDISNKRLSVSLPVPTLCGVQVTIEGDETLILGEICRCEPREDGYVIAVILAEPQGASAFGRVGSNTRNLVNLSRKDERRRQERRPMNVGLTIMWGETPEEENFARAQLVNMSSRGAKFQVAAKVPRGAWLIFNNQGVGGRGTVRYCALTKGQYEIGVELANDTEGDVAARADPHVDGETSEAGPARR